MEGAGWMARCEWWYILNLNLQQRLFLAKLWWKRLMHELYLGLREKLRPGSAELFIKNEREIWHMNFKDYIPQLGVYYLYFSMLWTSPLTLKTLTREKSWFLLSSSTCGKLDVPSAALWTSRCQRGLTFLPPSTCLLLFLSRIGYTNTRCVLCEPGSEGRKEGTWTSRAKRTWIDEIHRLKKTQANKQTTSQNRLNHFYYTEQMIPHYVVPSILYPNNADTVVLKALTAPFCWCLHLDRVCHAGWGVSPREGYLSYHRSVV